MGEPRLDEMIAAVRLAVDFVPPWREGQAECLIAVLAHLKASRWRPIAEAPKGRIILLWAITDRGENGEVTNWKMATGSTPFAGPTEWIWDGYRLREWDVQPTHWMPLPSPPATTSKGDGG